MASATVEIDLDNFPKIYCVKCKKKTANDKIRTEEAKNGRTLIRARCMKCRTKKVQIGPGAGKKKAKKSEDDDD